MKTIDPYRTGINLKTIVLGGSGFLAACATLFFLKRKFTNKSKYVSSITEEDIFEILRQIRKEFYPFFRLLAEKSKSLQSHLLRAGYPSEELKAILFQELVWNNPIFERNVEELEIRVLAKSSLTDPDVFKSKCLEYAKKNTRVNSIMKEIKESFHSAVFGVAPNPIISIPDSLKDVVMHQAKDMSRSVAMSLIRATSEFVEQFGRGSLKLPEYGQYIQSKIKEQPYDSKYTTQFPEALIRDYHPTQIYYMALAKFCQEDAEFKMKYEKIGKLTQNFIKRMGFDNTDYNELIREAEEFNIEISSPPKNKEFFIDLVEPIPLEVQRPDNSGPNEKKEDQMQTDESTPYKLVEGQNLNQRPENLDAIEPTNSKDEKSPVLDQENNAKSVADEPKTSDIEVKTEEHIKEASENQTARQDGESQVIPQFPETNDQIGNEQQTQTESAENTTPKQESSSFIDMVINTPIDTLIDHKE